jgi:hypothetical protein
MTFCLVAIICLLGDLPVGATLLRAGLAAAVLGVTAEICCRFGSLIIALGLRDAKERENQSDE